MTLLSDEVLAFVGREVKFTAPEELGRAAIRYFAVAVGDRNPKYLDGDVAPPTLVCETNQYMNGDVDEDGYAGFTWDLPVEGCRLVRGGHEYEFFRPVRATDVITAAWRVEDVSERNGKLFVVSEVTYTNQAGERLATNRETLVYVPA